MRTSAQCWMAVALLALVTLRPALAGDNGNQALFRVYDRLTGQSEVA